MAVVVKNLILILVLFLPAHSALAGAWRFEIIRDPMTDLSELRAEVVGRTDKVGKNIKLSLACVTKGKTNFAFRGFVRWVVLESNFEVSGRINSSNLENIHWEVPFSYRHDGKESVTVKGLPQVRNEKIYGVSLFGFPQSLSSPEEMAYVLMSSDLKFPGIDIIRGLRILGTKVFVQMIASDGQKVTITIPSLDDSEKKIFDSGCPIVVSKFWNDGPPKVGEEGTDRERLLKFQERADKKAAREVAELKQRRKEATERIRQEQLAQVRQSRQSLGQDPKAKAADNGDDLLTKAGVAGGAEIGDRTGVLADYAASIRAHIRPRISFDPARAPDNPEVVFVVEQKATGRILKVTKKKSSGNAGWDAAVERAIWGSSPLPKTADGTVESPLIIAFRPTSSNLSRQDDIDDRDLAYREAAAQEEQRLAEGVVQRGIREEKEFKQRQLENEEMIRQEQLVQLKDSLNQSVQSRKDESGSSKALKIDGLGLITSELKPGFYIQHYIAPSLSKALRFKLSDKGLAETVVYVLKRSPGGSSFNYILATGPFERIELAQVHVKRAGLPADVWIRPAYKIRPLLLDQQEWVLHLPALVADAQRMSKAATLLDSIGENSDR